VVVWTHARRPVVIVVPASYFLLRKGAVAPSESESGGDREERRSFTFLFRPPGLCWRVRKQVVSVSMEP